MDSKRFLECCCTDAAEAVEAMKGGAGRIELCEDLPCGGVSPSRSSIEAALTAVNIPVNVLVRARGGNFVYNEEEIEMMVKSVRMCRELGVNGVVVGALRNDESIDTEAVRRMVAEAEGLHVTFHRAFDECADPFAALEDIIDLGCDRLLTAGHASNVNVGEPMLKELNGRAAGRIIILAGSGVRPGNIARLEASTGCKEFHSSSHGPDGRTSHEVVAAMVDR
ncbi:MAG TPA: copper homeostasis protein CutC [Rikenellaceae bacterium]|nr:copper homeostasis protein CutC [Rikenellaceae bacterium]